MKILHLMLACFYIDHYSYQENYLPKHHKQQGHDVEIVASLFTFDENGKGKWLPKADKYINEYGIPVTRLAFADRPGAVKLRYYKGLQQELDRVKPELIFIHGVQFCDIGIVARYCKAHPEVQVFADNHSDFSNSATNWVSKHILHRIIWRSCAQKIQPYTTKFYGVLPARVDFLIRQYGLPKEKVELLVMGADDDLVEQASKPEVRESVRAKYGISDGDFVVMTGGKIDAFKTQTLLLMEAVAKIQDPAVKLVVFGSVTPELKDRVTALADGEKVSFIGWIPSKDSYELFAAADLVVFPGRHSVFWEQVAAQGLPMVVKHWAGTTHVDMGGNVRFLYEDSAQLIRSVIEDIRRPEHYSEMKAAAVNAADNFLYSKIADRSIR